MQDHQDHIEREPAEEPQQILRCIEITIPSGKNPERLDTFLARQVAELTRTKASEYISSGGITVDGKKVKPSVKTKPGQLICMEFYTRPRIDLIPEDIPLDIRYEDEWLIVVNKPAGMVVHPAQGNRTGTLVNALLHH